MRLIVEDEIVSLEGATYRVKVEPAPKPEDPSVWLTVRRVPAPWPVLRERWVSRADATARAKELKDALRSDAEQLSYRPALTRTHPRSRATPKPATEE